MSPWPAGPGPGTTRGRRATGERSQPGGGRVASLELAARLDEVARLVPDQAEQPARQVPGAEHLRGLAGRRTLPASPGRATRPRVGHRSQPEPSPSIVATATPAMGCPECAASSAGRKVSTALVHSPALSCAVPSARRVSAGSGRRAEQSEASPRKVLGVGFAREERRQERPSAYSRPPRVHGSQGASGWLSVAALAARIWPVRKRAQPCNDTSSTGGDPFRGQGVEPAQQGRELPGLDRRAVRSTRSGAWSTEPAASRCAIARCRSRPREVVSGTLVKLLPLALSELGAKVVGEQAVEAVPAPFPIERHEEQVGPLRPLSSAAASSRPSSSRHNSGVNRSSTDDAHDERAQVAVESCEHLVGEVVEDEGAGCRGTPR